MTDYIELTKAVAPITAAIIIVIGGAFAYRHQKDMDRKEVLLETKRLAYTQYVTALFEKSALQGVKISDKGHLHDHYTQRHIDALIDMQTAFANLMSVASDEVVGAVGEFNNYLNDTSGDRAERDVMQFSKLFGEMVISMRRDTLNSSLLSDAQISNAWRNGSAAVEKLSEEET